MNNKDKNLHHLLWEALVELGCTPSEENGEVIAQFQGETFVFIIAAPFIRVWCVDWAILKSDDPRLLIIRESIQMANHDFGPVIVEVEQNTDVRICARWEILLDFPQSADERVKYLNDIMMAFFESQNNLSAQYDQFVRNMNLNDKNDR